MTDSQAAEVTSIGGPGSERFSAAHHLRQREGFLRCYEEGRSQHGRMVVVFGRARGDAGPWRLGITATRKLGKAVVRNKLRRRVRECIRRHGAGLAPGWDIVVNLKRCAIEAAPDVFTRDLCQALRRLGFDVAATDQPPR